MGIGGKVVILDEGRRGVDVGGKREGFCGFVGVEMVELDIEVVGEDCLDVFDANEFGV